jgi:hypothetical protein
VISKAAFGHFGISLVKSLLRIAGGVLFFANGSIPQFVGCFLAAEILGILEEIFDKR